MVEMPIRPPIVSARGLMRAPQIVRPLMPLKRLSSDDAEIVARATAQSFAKGRKQGLDTAKAELEA
jgi:hypothetical protein